MTALNWYGAGALALILVVFRFVRRITVYLALELAIVGAFAMATFPSVDWDRPSEWIVMTAGFLACIFGLLIVRVMLIRSVSLHLLGKIEAAIQGSFGEELGGRLCDMRAFRLIRTTEGSNALTLFGRLVGNFVALFYSVFRIQT
jgi:hypothetical protein